MVLGLLLACSSGDRAPLFEPGEVQVSAPLAPPAWLVDIDPTSEWTQEQQANLRLAAFRDPASSLAWSETPYGRQWTLISTRPRCEVLRASPDPGVIPRLARCADPTDAERIQAGTPHDIVLWAADQVFAGNPVPDFVWPAANTLAASDSMEPLDTFLEALCVDDLPDHARQIEAVIESAAPGDRRILLGACPFQSDPAIVALMDRHCPECVGFRADGTIARPFFSDIDARIADGAWMPNFMRRFPHQRAAIEDALDRCARNYNSPSAGNCMKALSSADWKRAYRAWDYGPTSADPAVRDVGASLGRFESPRAVREHLVAIGLFAADRPPMTIWPSNKTTPSDWMLDLGLRTSTWRETPLMTLARIFADTDLSVVVTTIGAPHDEGFPTWQVWVGDTRYQHVAVVEGDVAMSGFVNAILAAEDADMRTAVLAGGSEIVWGPPEALRTLHEDGLMELHVTPE